MQPPPTHSPAALPGVGAVIADRYRIRARIGEGGMAVVFLADRLIDPREVAIKVLRPEIAGDPEVVRRFLQEARAASLIHHPNIVEIVDFGFSGDGVAFLAMERLHGEDLATLLAREGPLAWARLGPLALQIAAALRAAHAQGIVHRDVKPENCFCTVGPAGLPMIKVLDFGIAKDLGGQLPDRPRTATGMLCGSPEYMAPESIMGALADARSDLYGLGVTLYELLSGHHPFEGASVGEMLAAHVERPPPPLRRWGVAAPAEVEALVQRLLAKRPEERFADGAALEAAILATIDADEAMTVAAPRAPRGPAPVPSPVRAPVIARARERGPSGSSSMSSSSSDSPDSSDSSDSSSMSSSSSRATVIGVVIFVVASAAALILALALRGGPAPVAGPEASAAAGEGSGAAGTGEAAEAAADEDAATGGAVDAATPATSTSTSPTTTTTTATTDADKAAEEPATPPRGRPAAAAPARELSEAAVRREIARKLEARARTCLREHSSLVSGQRLAVTVTIDPAGKASTRAQLLARSAAARCIDELFRRHTFPRSPSGIELVVEFTPS